VAQVTIRINGYAYTVGCDDGQEPHLQLMAAAVEDRINSIKSLGGQSGEARLLVLASLLMADELHDQSAVLERLKAELQRPVSSETEGKRRLARLADKAEKIASGLEG
jgi:cell division protein ZapA